MFTIAGEYGISPQAVPYEIAGMVNLSPPPVLRCAGIPGKPAHFDPGTSRRAANLDRKAHRLAETGPCYGRSGALRRRAIVTL